MKAMKNAHVLMKEQPGEPADPVCVSKDIERLMDCALTEDLAVNMRPLREVGSFVPVDEGRAVLHIEPTEII